MHYVKSSVMALLCVATPAWGQDNCFRTLIPDTVGSTFSETIRLSVAWSLSESDYKERKRGAGINAVVYGVPMGANWNEYKKNVRTKAEALKLDRFEQRASAYASSILGDNALKAYRACEAAKHGLAIVLDSMSSSAYTVSLTYRPSTNTTRGIAGRLVGAKNIESNDERKVRDLVITMRSGDPADHEITVTANNAKEEASIDVNLGAQTRSLVLPPLTTPTPAPPQWQVVTVNLRGGTRQLRDGYELRNIRYRHLGPSPHRHEFSFDVHGPNGLVKADVKHVGDNGDRPSETSELAADGRILEFGFSKFNDGSGRFHYLLR